jgi:hypothetical protein
MCLTDFWCTGQRQLVWRCSGVNFTNFLCAAFMLVDPERSRKRLTINFTACFTFLGSELLVERWWNWQQVPSKGWFVFGGDKSALDKAEGLAAHDGDWELGPNLFGGRIDSGHCTVQVSNCTIFPKKSQFLFTRFSYDFVTLRHIFKWFQIDESTTAFLGGHTDPQRIVTFDWNTETYSLRPEKLIQVIIMNVRLAVLGLAALN